jgi:hypothetical protein
MGMNSTQKRFTPPKGPQTRQDVKSFSSKGTTFGGETLSKVGEYLCLHQPLRDYINIMVSLTL